MWPRSNPGNEPFGDFRQPTELPRHWQSLRWQERALPWHQNGSGRGPADGDLWSWFQEIMSGGRVPQKLGFLACSGVCYITITYYNMIWSPTWDLGDAVSVVFFSHGHSVALTILNSTRKSVHPGCCTRLVPQILGVKPKFRHILRSVYSWVTNCGWCLVAVLWSERVFRDKLVVGVIHLRHFFQNKAIRMIFFSLTLKSPLQPHFEIFSSAWIIGIQP